MLNPEGRDLAWKAWCDKRGKTSHRVLSLGLYAFIRACEIIDYWFPVNEPPRTDSSAR